MATARDGDPLQRTAAVEEPGARAVVGRQATREYVQDVSAGKSEGLVGIVDGAVVHSAYLMFGNKTACLLDYGRGVGLPGNSFTAPAHRGRQQSTLRYV